MIVMHASGDWDEGLSRAPVAQTMEQETAARASCRSRESENEPFIGWEPSVGDDTRRAVRHALRPNTRRNLGHTRRP
jgi:hypothetical protein